MNAKELGFELAHIGINQEDAAEAAITAALFSDLFGFKLRETGGSIFAAEQFEIMKKPFRGRLGHIAIRTADAGAARQYLEARGIVFDESSAVRGSDGSLLIISARDEIAGFAFHLVQKR